MDLQWPTGIEIIGDRCHGGELVVQFEPTVGGNTWVQVFRCCNFWIKQCFIATIGPYKWSLFGLSSYVVLQSSMENTIMDAVNENWCYKSSSTMALLLDSKCLTATFFDINNIVSTFGPYIQDKTEILYGEVLEAWKRLYILRYLRGEMLSAIQL